MKLTDRDLDALIAAAAEVEAGEFDETVYSNPEEAQAALSAAKEKLIAERERRRAKKEAPR